jgi:hypothetical protein
VPRKRRSSAKSAAHAARVRQSAGKHASRAADADKGVQPTQSGGADPTTPGAKAPPKGRRAESNRESELALYLRTAYVEFSEDRTNPLFAFDGLSYIAAYYWAGEEPQPTDCVSVPWWVVNAIAECYVLYWNAVMAGHITTLGQAFGIEGKGQGKQRRMTVKLREHRDRRVALMIARMLESGMTVEDVISRIAKGTKLKERTLWRIWQQKGAQAKKSVAAFRTANSSGSDGSDG